MAGNSFGNIFKITTYGESHGPGIGVVIDGCPSGIELDLTFIQAELDRRKPGQSKLVTQRKENENFVIQSGVFEGKTTGAPISIFIPNEDQRSKDYAHLADAYRPSHADYTYQMKYGHRDYTGGGRSSARETAARVAAGAVAKTLLKTYQIEIYAFVSQIGNLKIQSESIDYTKIESNEVRCPNEAVAKDMADLILKTKKEGDTIGGIVACHILNCPIGLGDPVFDKLHADLGKAMLSINAVKGFEIGSGFSSVTMKGSEHNDIFYNEGGHIKTKTNHSGGIQGGISNGMPITFRVAFKPVSTLMQPQPSVNSSGEEVVLEGRGRHDACVVPRAVPIVEAMAALVIADSLLLARAYGLGQP
ncbi:MAG: chorismate synthase [Chitinophagales bacterium]|nr:chorismate synthase [Chitinophagales bacterium]